MTREDLMGSVAAAAYIGVSRGWLAHHPPDAGGPARIKVGARVYYRKADLDHFLDVLARQESSRVSELPERAAPSRPPHSAVGESLHAAAIATRMRQQSDALREKGRPKG